MSKNTRDMLLLAVGFLLTASIIIFYLTSYDRVQKIGNDMLEKETNQQYMVEIYSLTKHDQAVIYGSQVISYLKTNWDAFDSVYLDNGTGAILVDNTEYFRTAGHAFYINSNAIYHIDLGYDANKIPNSVTITLRETPGS